jgi:hypothetical protein
VIVNNMIAKMAMAGPFFVLSALLSLIDAPPQRELAGGPDEAHLATLSSQAPHFTCAFFGSSVFGPNGPENY